MSSSVTFFAAFRSAQSPCCHTDWPSSVGSGTAFRCLSLLFQLLYREFLPVFLAPFLILLLYVFLLFRFILTKFPWAFLLLLAGFLSGTGASGASSPAPRQSADSRGLTRLAVRFFSFFASSASYAAFLAAL